MIVEKLHRFIPRAVYLGITTTQTQAADTPTAKGEQIYLAFAKLADLVGGVWVNHDPKFKVENQFAWAFNNKVIRGHAILGKGSPREKQGEAYIGWDPAAKNVYYVDCHGGDGRLQGNSIKLEGDELVYDFVSVVGSGSYRNAMRSTSKDEYQFTIFVKQKQDDSRRPHQDAPPKGGRSPSAGDGAGH